MNQNEWVRPINSLNEIFSPPSSSSSSFPRTRISIHKFIINEEIKSELEERIVKMAGNGEISIKRDVVETRFKKEKEKERKKKTLHPCLDWISIHIELYISERGKKKKNIPANYRSGNCSNAPLTNRRSREFTHSWRLSAHFRQFLQVSGTDALAA